MILSKQALALLRRGYVEDNCRLFDEADDQAARDLQSRGLVVFIDRRLPNRTRQGYQNLMEITARGYALSERLFT